MSCMLCHVCYDMYVCYVCYDMYVCMLCGGRGGGGGGGEGMVQYIFTIRKQHSVNKVHTLRYSVSKISEYKSRCCVFLLFCYILCRKSWYLVQ